MADRSGIQQLGQMTDTEHRTFVDEVIGRNGITIDPEAPGHPEFVNTVVTALSSEQASMRLLGMSLASWLIDACIDNRSVDQLLELSEAMRKSLLSGMNPIPEDMMMSALWLRSSLFWHYVSSGKADPNVLRAGAALLQACIAIRPQALEESEFVLAQAYRTDLSSALLVQP